MNRYLGVLSIVILTVVGFSSAQTVRQITDWRSSSYTLGLPDSAGTFVFGVSKADPVGTNPAHAPQLMRWSLADGSFTQLTTLSQGVYSPGLFLDSYAYAFSSSDDGQTLAIVTMDDLLGTNHDASLELYLLDDSGSATQQLTSSSSAAGSVFGVVLSGSANRALFLADTDPLGTNPSRFKQLFIVDADGTSLTQLTSAGSDEIGDFSISDDGSRIVFASTGDLTGGNADRTSELFTVLPDGSNLTQITNSNGGYHRPLISGNGALIVAEAGSNVLKIDWTGGPTTVLAAGLLGSISTNSRWVYYLGLNDDVYSVNTFTGTQTQLTTSPTFTAFSLPQVSGDNSTVTFLKSGEIHTMQSSGANLVALTTGSIQEVEPGPREIGATESGVVYNEGGDLYWRRFDDDSIVQLTTGNFSATPSVKTDGSLIGFRSFADLGGQNPSNELHVFTIEPDGTNVTRLTPTSFGFISFTNMAGNGDLIVYSTDQALYSIATTGGSPVLVVGNSGHGWFAQPIVSEDAQWVTYSSNADTDGLNPNGLSQIFRARTDGSVIERITANASNNSTRSTISGDGARVVWVSDADPLGTNLDSNVEIFLWDAATGVTQQLTTTVDASNADPVISDDGSTVYFLSDAPFSDPLAIPGGLKLWKLTIATGEIRRASGLRDPAIGFEAKDVFGTVNHSLIGADRVVSISRVNSTGENADRSKEMWDVDFNGAGNFDIDKQAPSVVRWSVQPGPLHYDVVRGDVANLSAGAGGTVDLGAVVCLEEDSPDNSTVGFEDAAQPAVGQVFFYLTRGALGSLIGPGSWGDGSGNAERLTAACSP